MLSAGAGVALKTRPLLSRRGLVQHKFVINFSDGLPGLPGPMCPQCADATNSVTSGVVYVRWGRTTCPATSELIYEGNMFC